MNRKAILGSTAALAVAAGVGVGVATLGGGSASGYGGGSSGTGTSTPATVRTASVGLGKVLTDGSGRVLYLFEADRPGVSNCANACAGVWPPLTTTGTPHAAGAAIASQLGSVRRGDGTTQVTYHGHPLYLYAGDNAPRDTNGQGLDQFGAKWYVLAPTGGKIDND
jgi:predicted lipoprotein with Yx(FWY)xxD motif